MTINNLKEIDKLLTLCRKHGVTTVKIDNVEFILDLSTNVKKTNKSVRNQELNTFGEISEHDKIETPNTLTPDELLFYSATGQMQNEA